MYQKTIKVGGYDSYICVVLGSTGPTIAKADGEITWSVVLRPKRHMMNIRPAHAYTNITNALTLTLFNPYPFSQDVRVSEKTFRIIHQFHMCKIWASGCYLNIKIFLIISTV